MADDNKRSKLFELTPDNCDSWDDQLQDILYSKNWTALYEASKVDPNPADEEEGKAPGINATNRRQAWGLVKCALSADIAKKVAKVPKGDVEALLGGYPQALLPRHRLQQIQAEEVAAQGKP